jgi:hypothetical protein
VAARHRQLATAQRIYAECDACGCAAIVLLRKGQNERDVRIPRASDAWRILYRRRSAVEREFGHADLVMLGRLAQALGRARAVPLAA